MDPTTVWLPLEEGIFGHRNRQIGREIKAEIKLLQLQVKEYPKLWTANQKSEESHGQIPYHSPWSNQPEDTLISVSRLWTDEAKLFCYRSHLSWCALFCFYCCCSYSINYLTNRFKANSLINFHNFPSFLLSLYPPPPHSAPTPAIHSASVSV